ncbi:hypothetical protein AALP_AA6G148600 [Arabis alpina]|uniref:40S ribosomal protein S15 n=1 Tax=Arabis alpina TaxID=50452 RepID=A0A087GPA6_ARAAL|nr:hypothetical protein AALP_AA6G148600 [Arabis alpina]
MLLLQRVSRFSKSRFNVDILQSFNFEVITCGFPPLEGKDKTLKAHPEDDFFGCGRPAKEDTVIHESLNDTIVILSDIWLDDQEVLGKLETVLDGFESEEIVPSLFVFMGNFSSRPCSSYSTLSQCLETLFKIVRVFRRSNQKMEPEVAAAGIVKKRTFKKFQFRGVDLDALLDMSTDDLVKHFSSRIRRRFSRGLTRKPMALIKKLRKAKRDAPTGEKPEPVRTHLRNMVIVPEMIGSIIGVYNGKTFNQVEIKPEMIGHYLAEFSISYKPVKHGRPGVGATNSSRFIPLK